jgi:hypothetical protein
MKIPVFVSCPTRLTVKQAISRKLVIDELERYQLEPRALGRSDYPTDLPLREVYVIAKHCSGGVILGFEQFLATSGSSNRGVAPRIKANKPVPFPSAWNHLEAGVLFGLRIPLLVFREPDLTGGVFDNGVTDAFIHAMPTTKMDEEDRAGFAQVFLKWQASVREHYYR